MSNSSYYEVYTEGDKPFIIDVSKYTEGRSGRKLPTSITLTLTGYRYRPSTPSCALFPPRIIITAQNAFDTSGQVIINEVGNRKTGASICINSQTSDSNSSCVDSGIVSFPFVINVRDAGSFPSSIVVTLSDGAIEAGVSGYSASGAPIASSTDSTIKVLMNSALLNDTYGTLNAIAVPIGLSKSFYTVTAGLSLHEELFGAGATPEYFVASHIHTKDLWGVTATPVNRDQLLLRTPLYFARTSDVPINWANGGIAYAIAFGGESNTWITELLQKGSVLSYFYRVHSVFGNLDSPLKIQRFDVVVGDLIPPPDKNTLPADTYYPTTLVTDLYREFVSVFKIFVLPNTETLTTPSTLTESLITNSVVLPVKRNEKSCFGGTFNLTYDY